MYVCATVVYTCRKRWKTLRDRYLRHCKESKNKSGSAARDRFRRQVYTQSVLTGLRWKQAFSQEGAVCLMAYA